MSLTPEQQALSDKLTAAANKELDGFPSAPGECAMFQRIGCTEVLGAGRAWHAGPDADGVATLLAQRGQEVTGTDGPQVGDLLIWTGEGHGPHGHIAMRVIGNRIAENATIHYNETGDARGFRPLDSLDPNYRVFRLWKAPGQ